MKKKLSKTKKIVIAVIALALALLSAASFIASAVISCTLESQREAERWQGESKMNFAQLSCFMPVDSPVKHADIFRFREAMMVKFMEAALETGSENQLFTDAWSTEGKAKAATALGKGEVHVTAVGGSFFDFHPIRLISGNYLKESDLMKDRVLLDEDTAWLLFGGTDLQGMELRINGFPYIVAGVFEREQDFASRKAYTAGMGIFMSYDGYSKLFEEEPGISCYEFCMAEPVKGFARSFAEEKFPIHGGDIVENSSRCSFGRLVKLMGKFGSRSMQTMGVVYPYWENAARCTEDYCLFLTFNGIITAIMPIVVLIMLI